MQAERAVSHNRDKSGYEALSDACRMARAMGPNTFDPDKAVEAVLYVASRVRGDLYATLKLLYLADKLHLHRYGRFLFGDEHYALPHGPVPQGAYDLIKFVRNDGNCASKLPHAPAREAFAVEGNTIRPLRDADEMAFSVSDEECMNEVIAEFSKENFSGLKAAVHDDAYNATGHCRLITPAAIATMADNPAALIQHLADSAP
jgi:hypothetical protein